MKYGLFALSLLTSIAIGSIGLAEDSCNQTSYGKCFSIHARFAVYTGDGMEVLWPVGSHRRLWVSAGSNRLNAMLGDYPDDFYIFGDFFVCPQEKDVPGHMRKICIKEMWNLKRVKR